MYQNYMNNLYSPYHNTYETMSKNIKEIENMYPEIYKIVYPIIQKICNQSSRPISENNLDELTDYIYNIIETDNTLNSSDTVPNIIDEKESVQSNNRENRKNPTYIKDLIKILLIRELINKPCFHDASMHFPSNIRAMSNFPNPAIPSFFDNTHNKMFY